ncbi:transposase [Cohnella laeviribosi]|jgi:transposase|uniref:transposase n=1 Tax=Cohnella laeviribosi TaxID=380174 RepID=UPI000367E40E|nr:transposase [Cohnella laeviribosi]
MSQKYDKDFKIQTVRMIQEQGKPVAQVARELGVSDNTLYRWISEFKQDPGKRQIQHT